MDASIKKLVGEHLKLEDTEELYFPKCFCILTKYPFHSFMRCLVKEIYRAVSERKSYSNRLIAFALRSCKQHFFFCYTQGLHS